MKSVLISTQPKWCELMASGKKTIEVRKTRPKIETPFKCYIYKSFGERKDSFAREIQTYFNCGKVIGEFVCNDIDEIRPCIEYYTDGYDIDDDSLSGICMTREQLREYGKGNSLYGWHISDLKIYDKPKDLGEFKAWRDCETPEKEYKNCTFGYRHPTHCEYCQRITRPPQSWMFVEELQ